MATAKPVKKAAKKAAPKAAAEKTGSATLPAEFFGIEPNIPVMHQVVTAQLAHRRSGTQSTKTRSEVRVVARSHSDKRERVALVKVQFVHHTSVVVVLHSDQSHVSTHNALQRK